MVAVPAVEDDGDVDIGDVAFAQNAVAGDAVADHVILRDADRAGIALVEQAGGQGAVIEGEFPGQPVELVGDHARNHVRDQHVQALGRQPASAPHALEGLRVVDLDPLRTTGVGAGEDGGVVHGVNSGG